MEYQITTRSAEETMNLGHKFVALCKSGSVFCLTGDLGAGKTTLVRGIAKALNIKSVVQSPTFNIMKLYLKGDRPLIHIDAYRLADINTDIGLDEYIGYETGITMIEWPMYIDYLIPKEAVYVELKHLGDDKRKILITSENMDLLEEIEND